MPMKSAPMKRVPVKSRPKKITVNPAVCDGFGFCCEILPEMIGRDEWGFPVIDDREIPDGLARAAEQAVQFCPRRALAMAPTTGGSKR
jgi:ferredoxin